MLLQRPVLSFRCPSDGQKRRGWRRGRIHIVGARLSTCHRACHRGMLFLVLIVLNRPYKGVQSATEMLPLKSEGVTNSFNCSFAFVDMRLADALVFSSVSVWMCMCLFVSATTLEPFQILSWHFYGSTDIVKSSYEFENACISDAAACACDLTSLVF